MNIVLYILGAVLYLAFGGWFGKKAIDVWGKGESKGIVPFLFFPVSSCEGNVGNRTDLPVSQVFDDKGNISAYHYASYRAALLFFWPLRFLFSMYSVTIAGLINVFCEISKMLFKPPPGLRKSKPLPWKQLPHSRPSSLSAPQEQKASHLLEQEIAAETKIAMDEIEHPEKKWEDLK